MAVSLLVADDDDLLRNLVKEVLEDEGYQVYTAADGQETVDIFWEHPEIALVILDIMMPKMDGIEVLQEIRERTDIPVLMLTALGDSSVSYRACGTEQVILSVNRFITIYW